MKLASVIALALVGCGIVACATGTDDPAETTGTTTQALCPVGVDCRPPKRGASSGAVTSGSSGVLDPGDPVYFQCNQDRCTGEIGVTQTYLDCNPANRNECVCVRCGSGGGWPYGSYNGCPWWKPNYGCNSGGYCTCY